MTGPTPVPADRGGGGGTAFPPPGEPPDRTTQHEHGDRPESAVEDGNLPGDAARSQRDSETSAAKGSPVTATETSPSETGDVEAGINALWRQFARAPEQRLRDRLVLHYAPLVKYVAGRVGTGLPTHVDVGDLVQSGIFGLVDAIEKFEPERGLRFETYAMQRIRGAILDDLRSQDWVPRVVRSRAREAERAMERLGARLNRTPTDAELAAELEISVDDLRDLYGQLQLTSVVALEDLVAVGKDSGSLVDTLPDDDAVDPVAVLVDQDNRRQLAEAIAQLTERDRIVVSLYYFESLTLAEIGKVLGVTESRVSQLHTRAVLRLRAKLVEQAGV
ncbi:FliA/WhiG family RNA polymerase sigma factor [Amycolatopsis magusensis]|uniref:FliA/WhiG family RNA polymerase sigma factor n=1 Tax=Amycolatopsis magusensis TaxID=882444 RepID=UPI001FDA6350|nr:FliA/WhiG family RNA polymerase sigma factor [Amycolatopsis magusensis]MDI5976006.1 FliA/WhiG family RNA polymerase sigma factor [Amycolatopsis magusensis]